MYLLCPSKPIGKAHRKHTREPMTEHELSQHHVAQPVDPTLKVDVAGKMRVDKQKSERCSFFLNNLVCLFSSHAVAPS
jgi:hypothetical protein